MKQARTVSNMSDQKRATLLQKLKHPKLSQSLPVVQCPLVNCALVHTCMKGTVRKQATYTFEHKNGA